MEYYKYPTQTFCVGVCESRGRRARDFPPFLQTTNSYRQALLAEPSLRHANQTVLQLRSKDEDD
jgi:hypothetical protein